ncbi:melanization protease 1-like [Pollicipes pollicipes]|uniref:melanization protease 1-like n=1 Tax=Pollicipes pollicipes TaxID=41117 RepID=UPI001884DECA|nr:melanization protease 1-like [Pollicipes pollicipes]
MVRLGELDFSTEPDCDPENPNDCADRHIDVPIDSLLAHPQFEGRAGAFAHDIALVQMSRAIPTTNFVRPICLPLDIGRLQGGQNAAVGQRTYIVGWGRSEESVGSFTPVLQEAAINVVPKSSCERLFRRSLKSTGLGNRVCAGNSGIDTCRGDSGGPLMVHDGTGRKWYLVGVTSFGTRDCGRNPAVYTRVTDYVDWVRDSLRARL